jgi:hypothetical protein
MSAISARPSACVLQQATHPGVSLLLQTKEKTNSTERSPTGRSLFVAFFNA